MCVWGREAFAGLDALLFEPSLDDGEVVIEVTRSAKVVDMIHKVIHEASGLVGKSCKIRDASIKIPRGATIAEDFKHAVAKDQQARARRNLARLSGKI